MKRLLTLVAALLLATAASADPRMEISDNFCHFVTSADAGGDEVFQADCKATINVQDGVAYGYAKVVRRLPRGFVDSFALSAGGAGVTPCTMVESNGTAYTSTNWVSRISVQKYRPKRKLWSTRVTFELYCLAGQQ